MEKFIGIDVHASSCTLAVVNIRGRLLQKTVIETSGHALVEAVRSVKGERHVCFEEGTQASWMFELLLPHCARVVVTLGEAHSGIKSDARDAVALANRMRTGRLSPVFKKPASFRKLRELARVYRMVVGDHVRTKNRVKAVFRAYGIRTPGASVYALEDRKEWLGKVKPAQRLGLGLLYRQLDDLQDLRDDARNQMLAEAKKHRICRVLETAPGLGPIGVAQLVPIVATPWRFRNARKFWSYAGLGLVYRSSADWERRGGEWVRSDRALARGLNRKSNRVLKSIFKSAAGVVVKAKKEPLYSGYVRTTQETKPNLAKLTLARKIAAITLSMWKHEEVYDPERAQPA